MNKQLNLEPLKTLILDKGLADETVQQVISVLRQYGYAKDVDSLIWYIENMMDNELSYF